MDSNSGIHSCPVEILWLVFLFLRPDSKSILSCRAVCRRFLESIDSSVEVQLALKLDSWGYQETLASRGLTRAELLSKLNAHVEAWGTLDCDESVLEIPSGAAYDLAQGVYVCVDTRDESTVTCVELPSRLTGAAHRVYTLRSVGFPIKDLAIDPSQDLIVLFEIPESSQRRPTLHFRKLSDGTAHPATRTPAVVTDHSTEHSHPIRIQIYESVVMFTWGTWTSSHLASIRVWNWHTGQLIWELLGRHNDCEGYLLSTSAVLMPHAEHNELELHVWSFCSDVSGELVQRFALPDPLLEDKRLRRVFIKGDMIPPPCDLGISSVPFRPQNITRMVKIGWGPRTTHCTGEIFVPAHRFTPPFDHLPSSAVPYPSWVSQGAHALATISPENALEVYNSSSRHVQMASDSTFMVEVHDFRISRRGDYRSGSWAGELVPPKGYLRPCWKVSRRISTELTGENAGCGVMVDDEHIVVIPSAPWGAAQTLIILTM